MGGGREGGGGVWQVARGSSGGAARDALVLEKMADGMFGRSHGGAVVFATSRRALFAPMLLWRFEARFVRAYLAW